VIRANRCEVVGEEEVNFAADGTSQCPNVDMFVGEGENPLARQSGTQDGRVDDSQSTQSDAE